MSLSALIRKRQPANFATATVATFATVQTKPKPCVATVASVAVANSETVKTENGKPCSRWLLHFTDRNDLPVTFTPAVNHAKALSYCPDAVATEPIAEGCRVAIAATDDDRRTCSQCLNLRGRACAIAKPGGLVSANLSYQPTTAVLQRCAGYLPNPNDPDQRPGRERWTGLIQKRGK